jgi:hypothetical protein
MRESLTVSDLRHADIVQLFRSLFLHTLNNAEQAEDLLNASPDIVNAA